MNFADISSGFFWVLRPISYPNPSLRCSRRWATGGIKPCCETLKWISSSLPSKNYVGILEAEADLCFDSLMIASRCESFQQMSQDYNILSTFFVLKDIHCFICWILKLKTKKKNGYSPFLFFKIKRIFLSVFCYKLLATPCRFFRSHHVKKINWFLSHAMLKD